MKDAETLPLTTARARLFELVEDLLEGGRDAVELSLRSHSERVVMVRKSVLDRMAADLDALRAEAGVGVKPLRGMATVEGEVDAFLARGRARQAELQAGKRTSLDQA